MDWAKATARRDEKYLSFGIWWVLCLRIYGMCTFYNSSVHWTGTCSEAIWNWSLHIWWRHQMETFSALLAICAVNSPVTGEFPAQSSVTRNFDISFDLHLNKRLSKQSWGWWLETPSPSLWPHRNVQIWLEQYCGCWYPCITRSPVTMELRMIDYVRPRLSWKGILATCATTVLRN